MSINNFGHYWCHMMIERLIAQGIDHFFVAPGSRSSPIVSAIARHGQAHIRQSIDERSLGFMALGYAKRTQKAGVVVVTSGTAVANLMPAVVEARMSLVPMLILTADRPYELRDSGANQTIEQANIFSHHTNKSYDLSSPSVTVSIKRSQSIFDQALNYAHRPRPGPVQINIQLREPLHNANDSLEWQKETGLAHVDHWCKAQFDHRDRLQNLFNRSKGLLVLGELFPSEVQQKIVGLAEKIQWPIFADITSNLRLTKHPLILHHFDVALNNHQFLKELDPEVVVHIGDRIVSKRFWSWIEKNEHLQFVRLSEYDNTVNHIGRGQHFCVGDLARTIDGLELKTKTRSVSPKIFDIHENVRQKVGDFLESSEHNEAYFAAKLVASISEPVNLFVSSSMPIRDLDQFASPSTQAIDVFANRGASGIDGVISSAVGVAVASKKPTILLIGDVAFLHDSNALMLLKESTTPLLIVVINNNGGGIFHFLPIGQEAEVVTPYLDTPHQVKIGALCEAHEVAYRRVGVKDFEGAIGQFFLGKESQVFEIGIERAINVALHKAVHLAIANQ
jgi:2-succinyl-5-enolpyruvyl-6-hydroxy-3-cyclohexene-1-carboxylate synthase